MLIHEPGRFGDPAYAVGSAAGIIIFRLIGRTITQCLLGQQARIDGLQHPVLMLFGGGSLRLGGRGTADATLMRVNVINPDYSRAICCGAVSRPPASSKAPPSLLTY